MTDYITYLDDAPDMEAEIDVSNTLTFLPFLKESYAFWNEKLFDNKLPDDGDGVKIRLSTKEGSAGYVSHNWKEGMDLDTMRRFDAKGKLYRCADNELCIRVELFGLKNQSFHETLIHEMCHLAVWTIDNILEVGNSSRDGYEEWRDWFAMSGLVNVQAVPGHSTPWQKWMLKCGIDPVAGLQSHRFQVDQAVDFTREKQKRQSKIREFTPRVKELAASNDVNVIPVRFFLDPRAGFEKVGENSRKIECIGLLSVFQFWNPMGKYFPLTDRRHTMMFLAFITADNKEGDTVQSSMISLDALYNLDMCEEWNRNGEQIKLLTQRGREWLPKLQRFLGNKLNPKERMTAEDLKDLLLTNIVE